MEDNGPVEGQIQRQEKVRQTQGIKHPSLNGSENWYTTLYVWVPKREMTLKTGFNPDKTKGIKECGEIPFHQQDFACENIVEIKQNENEQAQEHQNFPQYWVSERHY
jgi:hypothetical protein